MVLIRNNSEFIEFMKNSKILDSTKYVLTIDYMGRKKIFTFDDYVEISKEKKEEILRDLV